MLFLENNINLDNLANESNETNDMKSMGSVQVKNESLNCRVHANDEFLNCIPTRKVLIT